MWLIEVNWFLNFDNVNTLARSSMERAWKTAANNKWSNAYSRETLEDLLNWMLAPALVANSSREIESIMFSFCSAMVLVGKWNFVTLSVGHLENNRIRKPTILCAGNAAVANLPWTNLLRVDLCCALTAGSADIGGDLAPPGSCWIYSFIYSFFCLLVMNNLLADVIIIFWLW